MSFTPGTALLLNDRAVAGYYSIAMNWISPEAVDHADITFSVDKAWLGVHHIAPSQVVLLRYVNGQWVGLPTRQGPGSDTRYGFIATTPGFSYFAVAEKKSGAPVTLATIAPVELGPAVNTSNGATVSIPTGPAGGVVSAVQTTAPAAPVPVPLPPATAPAQPSLVQVFFPTEGLPLVTIIAWALVLVVLVVTAWLIHRWWIRRQNPALFRKYD
jgi:hypothetical protein